MDSGPVKSSRYYWDSVVFLVEKELYKVPKWAFERKSLVFSNAFNLPRKSRQEGGSSGKPIVLPDVTKREFESLLDVLYPSDPLEEPTLTPLEWEHILKLSSKYRFTQLRVHAIKQLWTLIEDDPIHRIILGRRFGVPDWLRSGYLQVIIRPEMLEESEAEKLGWVLALRVAQIRERRIMMMMPKGGGGEENNHNNINNNNNNKNVKYSDSSNLTTTTAAASGVPMKQKELMKMIGEMFEGDIHRAEDRHSEYGAPDPEDIDCSTLLCPTLDSSPVDLSHEFPSKNLSE